MFRCLADELDLVLPNERDPLAIINALFELDDPYEPDQSRRHRTFENITGIASDMLESHGSLKTPGKMSAIDWHHELYDRFCPTDAKRLAKMLRQLGYQRMVIGFDECRHLNVASKMERSIPHWKMSLIALQRAIKAADHCGAEMGNFTFWYTLLDTDSSIFNLVSWRGEFSPSCRLPYTLDPVPAWPFLPFNQMVPKSFESQTPHEATDIRRLLKYGRPVRVVTHEIVPVFSCGSPSSGQRKHLTAFDKLRD
jgi:hypothetical protein